MYVSLRAITEESHRKSSQKTKIWGNVSIDRECDCEDAEGVIGKEWKFHCRCGEAEKEKG